MIKINLKQEVIVGDVDYNNGEFALFSRFENIKDIADFEIEIRAAILCRSGRATVMIDGEVVEIHENDMFVCSKNTIINDCMFSADFDMCGFFFTKDFLERIVPMYGAGWDIKLFFDKSPVLALTVHEREMFELYYGLLKSRIEANDNSGIVSSIIDHIAGAFTLELGNAIHKRTAFTIRNITSSETIFRSFIELIQNTHPKDRRTAYYADKLNITPKYLSQVCKKASGETASQLIDKYVSQDIVYQLRHTQKTIKDISNELGFPNIFFFGMYCKNNIGMSPKQYREQKIRELSEKIEEKNEGGETKK